MTHISNSEDCHDNSLPDMRREGFPIIPIHKWTSPVASTQELTECYCALLEDSITLNAIKKHLDAVEAEIDDEDDRGNDKVAPEETVDAWDEILIDDDDVEMDVELYSD